MSFIPVHRDGKTIDVYHTRGFINIRTKKRVWPIMLEVAGI